jgi:hypothetical protein
MEKCIESNNGEKKKCFYFLGFRYLAVKDLERKEGPGGVASVFECWTNNTHTLGEI